MGIRLRDVVIISAHLVRPTEGEADRESASRLMEEITDILNRTTLETPDINIVIAIDANATLVRNQEDQSGPSLMELKTNHTPATYLPLHELMKQYDFYVPQTFNEDKEEDDLWTWSIGILKSHIDYILCGKKSIAGIRLFAGNLSKSGRRVAGGTIEAPTIQEDDRPRIKTEKEHAMMDAHGHSEQLPLPKTDRHRH